jgi:transposase-like protein
MGALEDGTKELLAVVDGYRESTQSWRELLQQLKRHGLTVAPKLAVGDGSLGFWLALQEEYGPVPQQRCWVHKTANILDKMPKSVQGRAKELIHEMYLSPTRKAALEAYDQFIASYQAKYPKATDCLEKDKEWLFTFYDFPAQHWSHLRTTNPIESTFATVRLRTQRTKGCGSRIATLTMVFKLGIEAQKHWRRLNGSSSRRGSRLNGMLPKLAHGTRKRSQGANTILSFSYFVTIKSTSNRAAANKQLPRRPGKSKRHWSHLRLQCSRDCGPKADPPWQSSG